MLGIHAANNGLKTPELAILLLVIEKMIYTNAIKKPKAIGKPAPSLDFFEDTITPMMVRIIIENG